MIAGKKRNVKQEPCNGDEEDTDSIFDIFGKDDDDLDNNIFNDSDERQLNMMDKLVCMCKITRFLFYPIS